MMHKTYSKSKSTTKRTMVVNGKRRALRKQTKSQVVVSWSRKHLSLILFMVFFASVGAYFLIKSFAATPSAPQNSFNVTTWNSAFDNPLNIGTSITTFGKNSDIIGIQEAHTPAQRNNIKSKLLCSSCKYSGYIKDYTYNGSSPASLPILWNKAKFSYVSKGYYTMSTKVTGINDLTGKNMSVSAKYITYVQLRDKVTTRSFYVLNLHTVASVESTDYYFAKSGVPIGYPLTPNAKRIEIYKKGMDVLVSKVKALTPTGRPIIILGDFNVDYRTDSVIQSPIFPYARLKPINVTSSFQTLNQVPVDPVAATHGTTGRLIDYVFALKHNRLTVNNEYIDAGTYGSDHHPVTNTLTIYNADPATLPAPAPLPIGTSTSEAISTVASDAVLAE